MAQQSLADYIKKQIESGYALITIKNFLLRNGYQSKEIDEAVSLAYKPTIRHEIHLSKTTILVVIFIVISLISLFGVLFLFGPLKNQIPGKLLDLNLEPVITTIKPGESIVFVKELSNQGSSKRYDVTIKHELINKKTNKIITQKTETRAIETFGSTQTKILVPIDTKPGDYIVRTIVDYDTKKAIAILPVKIISLSQNRIVDSGVVDSGVVDGGIVDREICFDCKKDQLTSINIDAPKTLTLDDIKELSKTEPQKAFGYCDDFDVPDLKDTCIANVADTQRNKDYCQQIINVRIKDKCYSNIAKSLNDKLICDEIVTDAERDSCYITFVLDNKDYSVCEKVINKYLKQSCESLRQLDEIKKKVNNKDQ